MNTITMISFLALVLLIALFVRDPRKRSVQRWMKALRLREHALAFAKLYESVNGFTLSKTARKDKDALDYVYGEIEFLPFIALMSLTQPNAHTRFCDLGSGTGKAVLAMAMVFPVEKSQGIELFSTLHQQALDQKEALAAMPAYQEQAKSIEFTEGHFLNVDFADANLIFVNSSSFVGELWEALSNKIETSTQCPIVVTTSKPLPSEHYEPIHKTQLQVSWGIVDAYIHKRL